MPSLSRIGVAIESDLLERFDTHIAQLGYENRSEAFRDLIRASLTAASAANPREKAMGTLTLLYDHHVGGLAGKLTELQHDSESMILSTMHVHVTHHLCLEVIVLRGCVEDLEKLAGALGSLRGVQHAKLVIAAAGSLA
ncbi:MAG: nickel-responsive transcriptional regulator NikR [Bryobacterales bacterium]|nr:nickel-responsive transcriptional regulator NikR [Bryobacterales bacterium]